MLSDSNIHAPPSSGNQNYNANPFADLPTIGNTYVDGVFGETIRRLTNIGANANLDQNYCFHNINADGTLAFHTTPAGAFNIISTADGSTVYASQPTGLAEAEARWSMTDPDKYYYWATTHLWRRNLAAQTNTDMRPSNGGAFPGTLQTMGGSQNYQDKTDRYFILKYGGTAKLWDSQTDTIYTNSVTPLDAGGWVTISPSGAYVVTASGSSPDPNQEHYSYAVNHGTQTISASPIHYWGMGGDHSVLVSASDGKDYAIVFENYNVGAVYRCDLSTNIGGLSAAAQRAASFELLSDTSVGGFNFDVGSGHLTNVSVGSFQDWVIFSSETEDDDFNQSTAGWPRYRSEIIALNVLTGARRRLAHHRSRGLNSGYYWYPRLSSAPNGSAVLWASNMNDSTPADYADLYGIANPLGASSSTGAFIWAGSKSLR